MSIEKDVVLFRNLVANRVKWCQESQEKQLAMNRDISLPAFDRETAFRVANIYKHELAAIARVMEDFEEVFREYSPLEAGAAPEEEQEKQPRDEELLAICERVHWRCSDECPVYEASGGNPPTVHFQCACFKDGQKMMRYLDDIEQKQGRAA